MALDGTVQAAEAADGATAPDIPAPGSATHGGLVQIPPPPDFWG